MPSIRKIVKDMVDTIPEEKLKSLIEILEEIKEGDIKEAWSIWDNFGKDAIEGKWEDASERHDFYLYGIKG
ncbi:MAG: hypothetical protein CO148_09010 [Nitrospirae bacterium CG_4_9_14_3_um_filter_41_27]|nr:MAG: hypothetical protein CO148_09010 [Nitrospirae bacterium CG_4_9_14_3_um_filter_41_27]